METINSDGRYQEYWLDYDYDYFSDKVSMVSITQTITYCWIILTVTSFNKHTCHYLVFIRLTKIETVMEPTSLQFLTMLF